MATAYFPFALSLSKGPAPGRGAGFGPWDCARDGQLGPNGLLS